MGKISKQQMKKHQEALVLLEKDVLSYNDKEFVFEHYHEGATNMNNLISAHFTPNMVALSLTQNVRNPAFVDLCAGIGKLAWYMVRGNYLDMRDPNKEYPFKSVCVELNQEYCKIGKKLIPEVHWINGSIFDNKVIDEIMDYMKDANFSVISNPPYGRTVNPDVKDLLYYSGPEFEYKTIELGALLGGQEGVFLVPQESCNFKFSNGYSISKVPDHQLSSKYKKFVKDTELEISPNIGFCTDIPDDMDGWKDVSIVTEIAILEYEDFDYKPKYPIAKESSKAYQQMDLFD